MSETQTSQWRQICLQAMGEVEPDRRMAILEKLGHLLLRDRHDFGPHWVDFGHAMVKRNGNVVGLTNLELRLLRYLIERGGRLVSRDELLRSVWGYNSGTFTRTVDMHIHSLRRKLEQDAKRPEFIVTVKGAGYKFVASEAERW
jgi:two-component system, OmpR family, alkaline phosphatase synthesis response regulator PhoP